MRFGDPFGWAWVLATGGQRVGACGRFCNGTAAAAAQERQARSFLGTFGAGTRCARYWKGPSCARPYQLHRGRLAFRIAVDPGQSRHCCKLVFREHRNMWRAHSDLRAGRILPGDSSRGAGHRSGCALGLCLALGGRARGNSSGDGLEQLDHRRHHCLRRTVGRDQTIASTLAGRGTAVRPGVSAIAEEMLGV
jgi:hypothetical protein